MLQSFPVWQQRAEEEESRDTQLVVELQQKSDGNLESTVVQELKRLLAHVDARVPSESKACASESVMLEADVANSRPDMRDTMHVMPNL